MQIYLREIYYKMFYLCKKSVFFIIHIYLSKVASFV